ncbi:hypothetical protein MATL_G00153400 [Megalops atlanticus]|uniref:BCL6 corepressor n=1 Tax=Megalops atlanticus TaxID=7932 RepID=A0A9D3PUT0_MEGAT|nr:hypothetical protein MATL_G00153400 [Megalops atlanticus]
MVIAVPPTGLLGSANIFCPEASQGGDVMLSATPLYGTIPTWISNERARMCGINEDRKAPGSCGEPQKKHLELRDGNHTVQSMVDASAASRMNPLVALSMEQGGLMRPHSGMVYPGIQALSTDKAGREGSSSVGLGYLSDRISDLYYKPDVALESRKAASDYVGLYKSAPPGLPKPMLVPGAGGESLGLEHHMGPGDKQSDRSLGGSGGYLRLPWISPYPDAGMYSYLDSTKYALGMYKASFLSQPPPYLQQHLAYQSLCAGPGGSSVGAERMFYVPRYAPAPISSPLAPPLRVTPAGLSTLVHGQEKNAGPHIHQEPPHFGRQVQQLHPQPHSERTHSSNSKSSRDTSSKGSSGFSLSSSSSGSSNSSSSSSSNSKSSSLPVDSTSAILLPSPRTPSRLTQPSAPPPPPHPINSTLDPQKLLPRGLHSSSSSSSSSSHAVCVSGGRLGPASPALPDSHNPKSREGGSERQGCGADRKSVKSPSKTSSEKPAQRTPSKDPADKPLDLSAKLGDFGSPPNGFPHRLEVSAKLGHSSSARYGLPPSREVLKETLSSSYSSYSPAASSSSYSSTSSSSSSVSTSSRPPERPEIISTLHSSWVVPGSAPARSAEANHNQVPTIVRNKHLDRVDPQQRSSSCPRIGESRCTPAPNSTPTVVTPTGRPASASPSPNVNSEWPKASPSIPEKDVTASHVICQTSSGSKKPTKAPERPESQEITYKQLHLENGHAPSHLYLPQNNTFLPSNLAYTNRYVPFSVPDSVPLSHVAMPGKGPVYPHPVLLGSSSLYPAHLAPKHCLPYTLPPSHGEYLTYHDSQEMVHPLMSPRLTLDSKGGEHVEQRSRPQDKHRHSQDSARPSRHTAEPAGTPPRPDRKEEKPPPAVGISLIQDDTLGGSQKAPSALPARKGDPSRPPGSGPDSSDGAEPELMQLLLSRQQAEACRRPHAQAQGVGDKRFSPARLSPSEDSPSPPDLPEQQTLRCARTSGDRSHKDRLKEGPGHAEAQRDDDDGSHCSSKTWRSSLAKRIANSSGYVGDRFKNVTTELYGDSSKLSREQRALQMEGLSQEDSIINQPATNCERAMMRFSELELKEKEGSSVAEQELAGGQHGVGDWDGGQHSGGDRDGSQCGSRPGSPAPAQAQREGVHAECGSSRVPVLQRCDARCETPPLRGQDQGRGSEKAGWTLEDARPIGMQTSARKRTLSLGEGQGEAKDAEETQARRPRLMGSELSGPLNPMNSEGADPTTILPPQDHAHLPNGPAQLSDKRQRLQEQRRHGDAEKPKGKRPCKTKHTSLRERRAASRTAQEQSGPHPQQQVCLEQSSSKRSASLSDYDSPPVKPCAPSLCPVTPQTPLQKPPSQPSAADTPTGRPMPPEARRLIVNKNAGETLLQRAARLGYQEVVLYCLENKVCDVNHRDNAGYCALHEACARGWLPIVQNLLQHGADINCSAQDGTRPLHDAVENDHLDVVRLLLSYGADPTLATYSGRTLLRMTHSDLMESFLLDYFADLQGRADNDPKLCWDFYGSAVCEPVEDAGHWDVLANPPGPEDEEEEEQREVFEFEFSDQPLLPCYNIQVSLSQGPRNWLLLSDVLGRLRMSPPAFRAAFPHIPVAAIAEAEFHRQASVSQLRSPDELEGFLPDSAEPLHLVQAGRELATLLGSSLERLDGRWDAVAMETL